MCVFGRVGVDSRGEWARIMWQLGEDGADGRSERARWGERVCVRGAPSSHPPLWCCGVVDHVDMYPTTR